MNKIQKERVWNKVTELAEAIDKANDQIPNIQDSIRKNENINYSNILRLRSTLDSALLELENAN
jgi:hypothetical protein